MFGDFSARPKRHGTPSFASDLLAAPRRTGSVGGSSNAGRDDAASADTIATSPPLAARPSAMSEPTAAATNVPADPSTVTAGGAPIHPPAPPTSPPAEPP